MTEKQKPRRRSRGTPGVMNPNLEKSFSGFQQASEQDALREIELEKLILDAEQGRDLYDLHDNLPFGALIKNADAAPVDYEFYETGEEILDSSVEHYEEKLGLLNGDKALIDLAGSIHKAGLTSPLVVIPAGDKYKIVNGHRRYLAHWLLKRESAPCVVKKGVSLLRYLAIQGEDNRNRIDLSLREELRHAMRLQSAYTEHADTSVLLTPKKLIELGGYSKTTGYRYHDLLNAHQALRDAILDNTITKKRLAEQLVKMPEEKLLIALSAIRKVGEEMTIKGSSEVIEHASHEKTKKPENQTKEEAPKKAGRPATSIKITTKSLPVAQNLFQRLTAGSDDKELVEGVDLNNLSSIQEYINVLIKKLEVEVKDA